MTIIRIMVGVVLLCWGVAAWGGMTPRLISYQGYLKDGTGKPVTVPTNLTFRLYSSTRAQSGAIWNETQSGVPFTNGAYSVILGSVTPINLPFDVQYFLGVTVGGEGELTPRQPLTAAPYALRAAQSDGVATTSQIVSTVPDGTPPLAVASTTLVPNLNADMVDNRHAADFVLKTGDTMSGTLAIANGRLDLPNTVSATSGVLSLGGAPILHAYGNYNIFIGKPSGNFVMTGSGHNTALGYNTLVTNISGTNNTANGSFALMQNTTGGNNTAIGVDSMVQNTAGYANTAIGSQSLRSNTTAYTNTALGASALFSNTSGFDNTAVGYAPLFYNTIGEGNTAVGNRSLYNNTTASYNTALGISALHDQSYDFGGATYPTYNTAVGFEALYANQPNSASTGVNNSAVGARTLHNNITGVNNTATGFNALGVSTTGSWNTAVGSMALSANTTGNSSTAVGFGSLDSATTGGSNSAVGTSTLASTTTGYQNVAIGYSAGGWNSTGWGNTFIGAYANTNNISSGAYSNATAVGYNALVNASNKVRIGNTSVTVIEGQVGWSNPSDIRLKKDVADMTYGIEFIKALRPVEFRMKDGNGRKDFGFVAQDVEALLGTEYNVLGIGEDTDRTLTLRYTDFIAPLVKAIQEQQAIIEQLKAEVAELRRRFK